VRVGKYILPKGICIFLFSVLGRGQR